MEQKIIDAVAKAGFDVWMRKPGDSWLLFTDGKNIGYLQVDRLAGYTISTVHMPNRSTGTGFQIERHVSSFDKDTFARAFVHAPDWYRGDAASVRKYRDMDHYCTESSFNAAYELVAKADNEAATCP